MYFPYSVGRSDCWVCGSVLFAVCLLRKGRVCGSGFVVRRSVIINYWEGSGCYIVG